MARILIAEPRDFSGAAAEKLRAAEHVLELADLGRDELIARIGEADVLWVRLRHRVDAELIGAANRLQAIVTPTTGLNHIDLEAAERAQVSVLSLRGEVDFLKEIRATAEHTLALIFMLLRNLPAATRHVEAGGWDRDEFKGGELRGKTVGIVGHGRLGSIVREYVEALGATVVATDPLLPASEKLEVVLKAADIVTLHAALTPETAGLIGSAELATLRPGSYLINTARGDLVDEEALLEALRSGQLGGAALDVLSGEDSAGMSHHPLVAYARDHDNLLITPHIGGATHESMEKTELFMARRLLEFLNR